VDEREEALDGALGEISLLRHDDGSVPRQTGDVTPDPAAIDAHARDHVIVEGPDALTYLHSQIAQDIRDLAVGESRWTLVLEPTGKIDSLARVVRAGDDRFDFDIDAGFGNALAARLNRFKIRVEADISVVPAASTEPSADHEAARVSAGWPRMGVEIEPGETIPAVTGVVPLAVSFTKGCYPGQELVERMDSRGADAPRSLRIVEVGGGVQVGDPLVDAAGADIGTITSVSPHGGLALAYVKRGHDIGRLPPHLAAPDLDPDRGVVGVGMSGGGGERAADRHDVGILADADQLGGTVDDRGQSGR
jgi:hypothetical protein